MKSLKKWCVASVVALAASGAVVAAAPAAGAAVTVDPAVTGDPNASNGSISFYDATGNVVTGGSNLSHLFDYAAASTPGRTGTTKATVYFAFPDHTKADSTTWFQSQRTASTTFPDVTTPAPIGLTVPVAKAAGTEADLAALLPTTTLDTTPGFAGIVQVRLKDSGPGIAVQTKPFWATDILFDSAAGTWQQVFPAARTGTAFSAISPAPASPAAAATPVTLTATLSATDLSHPAGTVRLLDGTTDLGPVDTFTAATGAVSDTITPAAGTHSYRFAFVPDAPATYVASSSAALAYQVLGAPDQPTGVQAVAGNAAATVSWTAPASGGGSPVTGYTVEVTPAGGAATTRTVGNVTTTSVTGLTNGTSYTFRVAATNAGATGAFSAVSNAVTPKGTATLKASANSAITYGTSRAIAVKLTSDSTAVAGATVTLYQRPAGSASYARVRDYTTNASGVAGLTVKPVRTTVYQWRFAGNTAHTAATSVTTTVAVAYKVSVRASKNPIRHGLVEKLYGGVAPTATGQYVYLQRYTRGAWHTSTVKARIVKQKLPNGTTGYGYVLAFTTGSKGKYIYRAYKPGTSTNAAGYSPAVTLTVG